MPQDQPRPSAADELRRTHADCIKRGDEWVRWAEAQTEAYFANDGMVLARHCYEMADVASYRLAQLGESLS